MQPQYIILLIVGIFTYDQNTSFEDKYKVEFKFVQEETKELLPESIIEIFSGNERIDVGISDFSGNQYFYLKKRRIKHNTINIKVYGIKCKVHKQKLIFKNNLKKIFWVLQRVHDFAWLETANFFAFCIMKSQKNLRIASKSHYNDAQSKIIT